MTKEKEKYSLRIIVHSFPNRDLSQKWLALYEQEFWKGILYECKYFIAKIFNWKMFLNDGTLVKFLSICSQKTKAK